MKNKRGENYYILSNKSIKKNHLKEVSSAKTTLYCPRITFFAGDMVYLLELIFEIAMAIYLPPVCAPSECYERDEVVCGQRGGIFIDFCIFNQIQRCLFHPNNLKFNSPFWSFLVHLLALY